MKSEHHVTNMMQIAAQCCEHGKSTIKLRFRSCLATFELFQDRTMHNMHIPVLQSPLEWEASKNILNVISPFAKLYRIEWKATLFRYAYNTLHRQWVLWG